MTCTRGSPGLLLATSLVFTGTGCPDFPEPPDDCAPEITGIDGDGAEHPVNDVVGSTAGVADAQNATHRFQTSWTVSGTCLGSLTAATLDPSDEGNPLSLEIVPGGTAMKRTLQLPASLYAGAFILTLTSPAGSAQAQTYVLQGEPGIACWDTNQNGIDDDVDVNGDGVLDVQDCQTSSNCPDGYDLQDYSMAGGAICEDILTGDQMVRVGDYWIDRYEVSMWSDPGCTGIQYGVADDDVHEAGFSHNGMWTTPLYACSLENEEPAAWITLFQAQQACGLSGKSLCTNAQWQAAAAGTPDVTEACNIDHGELEDTGANLDCESVWGAVDMVGNLWEWVTGWHQAGTTNPAFEPGTDYTGAWGGEFGDDSTWNVNGRTSGNTGYVNGLPAAKMRGGDWTHGVESGMFSLNMGHAPSDSGNYLGFRCCRQD